MTQGSSYTPGREIARGGMGAILSATDQTLDREVAMKVMLEAGEKDAVARQRFLREALVLARLEHPNIVPIHEMGRDAQGRRYYTMKLVKGRTLQAIITAIKKGDAATTQHYTLDRLLTIYRKVCDAMAFAHHHRIIHRDLKPENVMVGEFGEVLVMDWGLAKHLDDEAHSQTEAESVAKAGPIDGFQELSDDELARGAGNLTLDGSVMGSPQYMPPEQAEGRLADIGTHSDIYSLGGILYAILTLRPPVEGRKVAEVLDNVKSGNITPPTHYSASRAGKVKVTGGEVADASKAVGLPHCPDGKVPPSLSAVTMRAMAFQPADRYASVGQIVADIEAYQGGFATSAEKANALTLVRLFIHRHKALTAAGSLMVLLTVAFLGKLVTSEQQAKAEAVKARKALAKSALSLAEAAMREADGPAMQTALNDVPADLRDPTWDYLLAQSDSSIARIRMGTASTEGAAADPSRPGVFAIADQSHKITLVNVRNGERLLEFQPGFSQPEKGSQYRLAFSPDGQRLAVGRDGLGGLVIHRARDGTKLAEWATPVSDQVEFGDDVKLLRHGGKTLQVWNSHTGNLLWEDKVVDIIGVVGSFIPGGNEVLKMTMQNRLQVVRANDGGLVRNLGGRVPYYYWRMVVHPDGRSAFTYTVGGITECVSLADGKTLFTLPQKQRRDWLGVTADGDQLVTVAIKSDGAHLIEVWEARTGNAIRSLLGGQGTVATLSVHPRSNELLISGANTRVWDLTGQLPAWRLPSFLSGTAAFWGSDDLLLCMAAEGGNTGLHRLVRNEAQLVWQPKERHNYAAAVSARGDIAVLARPGFSTEVELLRKTGEMATQFGKLEVGFWPYRLRPSPNGKVLVAMERSNSGRTRVQDVATGKTVFAIPEPTQLNDMGWLGDERLVGLLTLKASRGRAGSEECIRLWDAATGQVLQTVTNRTAMDVLAVAPDGKRLAEAGADKLIRIRDARTLQVQNVFRVHDARITVMAWHPTKPMIATGSEDLSVKVLDIERATFVHEFRGLLNPPNHMSFSTTGKHLAVKTESEQLIRIWRLGEEVSISQRKPETSTVATPQVWDNLLSQLTPQLVEQTGNGWRMENDALLSPTIRYGALTFPGNFSGTSYQVRLKLRRRTMHDAISLSLPVGDRMVCFAVDGYPSQGYFSGLATIDGKTINNQGTGSVRGMLIKDLEEHTLQVTVQLAAPNVTVTTTLDARSLHTWTGATAALGRYQIWDTTPPGAIALATVGPDWTVSEVKVKRLDVK